MAGSARRIVVQFLGEDKSLSRAAAGIESKTSKLGDTFKKMGAAAAAGFAVLGAAAIKGGVDAIGKASDLNETLSKSQVIFGKNAAAMERWADGAARSAGLSKAAALDAASGFGDMFSQIGFTGDQAAKMSKKVVQMSADLGSFNNLETSDVADRMSAAFRGEYDSLQALIPNINGARVESVALAKTGKENAKQLTAQEKAAAVLAIVNKDGARAMGDFGRTSGSLANQQKILKAQFENVQASIGQKLLPMATKLFVWFNDKGLPAMQRFGTYLRATLPPIFAKVQAVVSRVMGALRGDVGGNLSAIKQIFRDAVSIITSLWRSFGPGLVAFIKPAFDAIVSVIKGAFTIIRGIFKTVSSLLKGDWKGVWEGIKLILRGAVTALVGIVKFLWNTVKLVFRSAGVALKGMVKTTWNGALTLFRLGVNGIVNLIRGIPGKIGALGGAMAKAGKGLLQSFLNGMKNAAGFIGGIAGNVWSAIKGLLNGAIDRINGALEFTIDPPGPGSYTVNPPNIPHLAKGGLVTKPTLALIGEDGPEAVVPLGAKNRPKGSLSGLGGSGANAGGITMVNQFNGLVTDPVAVAKQIEKVLIQLTRATGRPVQIVTLPS